jgi:ABC-type Fe3+-hydroxamate transport system substrate-binding protein
MILFPHEELRDFPGHPGRCPSSFDRPVPQLYHPRAMNQRAGRRPLRIFLLIIAAASVIAPCLGCGSRNSSSATQQADDSTPHIVSLVPAATDMLLAMGAGDRLVAVSNYDLTPATASLPRVGDYQTTDWEKISQLRPGVIVTEFGPGRTPPGFTERCASLGIRQLNLQIQRLDDIYTALAQLGDATGMPDRAATAEKQLRNQIAALRQRIAGDPPVPALIVTGEDALMVAGAGNYLDDLLTAAGGKNVVTAPGYPTLDREKLAILAPQVILQLLPSAGPRELASARQLWATLPDIPAVRNHRVVIITDWYAELPGYEVGDLAEKFAEAMHRKRAESRPALSADAVHGFPLPWYSGGGLGWGSFANTELHRPAALDPHRLPLVPARWRGRRAS